MNSFSRAVRAYIWTIIGAGALAFGQALYAQNWAALSGKWYLPLILFAATGWAAGHKVRLFGKPGSSDSDATTSHMSLGFVPTLFTLLYFGPLAGMSAGAVSALVTTRWKKRSPYYQVLFSIAAVGLSVFAATAVLHPVGLATGNVKSIPWNNWESLVIKLPSIFLATLVYAVVNTFSIATAVALADGQPPLRVWRANFLWAGPGYFAGASCATAFFALVARRLENPSATLILGALVLIAPLLWVTFYSYKVSMDKVHASEQHIEELEQNKRDLEHLYRSTVESLALAIEAKDRYTREHILRVQKVAVAIAEQMGVTGDELKGIDTGALLHDIGKLGIPEHILAKPGKLTEDEMANIREHPALGSKILAPVHFPWPVLPAVRSHHEKWDGSGYPDRLRGEDIPLAGRIMAVADVYDALTSERSYRESWSHEDACAHMRAGAGTHFDPAAMDAFDVVMEKCPHLRSGGAREKPVRDRTIESQEAAAGIEHANFAFVSLYEISQTVSVTLNLSETLILLASKIHKIFGSTACVLMLSPDPLSSEQVNGAAAPFRASLPLLLRAEAAIGANENYLRGATLKRGDGGMSERVFLSGEGTVGEYDRSDLLLASDPSPWKPLKSAMIVPLFGTADRTLLGTINLYHEDVNAFDAQDLRVLAAVSAQAGRAIENARTFERTRESALTDVLTGLHNARYLQMFLEQEMHRAVREGRPLSVLVMDLDNFKPINDTFGHARGNAVLRDLGGLFRDSLRAGDLFARYAGDEFVAVLPDTGPVEALIVAEKVRSVVAGYDPRMSGGDLGGIRVGISVGAASLPGDALDAATLIACADAAMYRDKSSRKRGKTTKKAKKDVQPSVAAAPSAANPLPEAAAPIGPVDPDGPPNLVLTRVA